MRRAKGSRFGGFGGSDGGGSLDLFRRALELRRCLGTEKDDCRWCRLGDWIVGETLLCTAELVSRGTAVYVGEPRWGRGRDCGVGAPCLRFLLSRSFWRNSASNVADDFVGSGVGGLDSTVSLTGGSDDEGIVGEGF
jgi:hypothetical protein